MGQDKAATVLAGRTLLGRVLDAVLAVPGVGEAIIVAAPGQPLEPWSPDAPVTVVRDPVEGLGPLAAIATGLAAARSPVAIVVGCDTPFVRPALLALLADRAGVHAAVVPIYEGRVQLLCSAVRRDALPAIEAAVAAGKRAAAMIADLPGAERVGRDVWGTADPEGVSFIGTNTPEELTRAKALAVALDAR